MGCATCLSEPHRPGFLQDRWRYCAGPPGPPRPRAPPSPPRAPQRRPTVPTRPPPRRPQPLHRHPRPAPLESPPAQTYTGPPSPFDVALARLESRPRHEDAVHDGPRPLTPDP